MRAADYDDWVTETVTKNGKTMHGLNGDILVWNPVTRRRHELTSMGIRVNPETLKQQLKMTNQLDWLDLPYHRDRQRRFAAERRRRHRPGPHADGLAEEGPSRRGQRHRVAEGPQGHVPEEAHLRARIGPHQTLWRNDLIAREAHGLQPVGFFRSSGYPASAGY